MRLPLAEGSTGLGESKVMSALLKDGSGYWLLCFPLGFPGGTGGKEPASTTGDSGLIPGSGTSPGEEHVCPHRYSCLENPMDRGAWQAIVHGAANSRT